MTADTVTEQPSIWIKTDMAPDESGYVVTLEVNDDTARILTPAAALLYAAGVMGAVARAEYDAAVMRQLTEKLSVPLSSAVQIIRDLRADRPPLDPASTSPLTLEPGVNSKLNPFLTLILDGQPIGQWDMKDARGHAESVIEATSVADLDSGYLRTLISAVGIEKPRARNVVGDLVNYR